MRQDREHLRILATCHYVYSALVLLGSAVPGFYIFIGAFMTTFPAYSGATTPGSPPPELFGRLIIVFGSIGVVLMVTTSILTAVAGYNLARYRRRTFCFVIACINCIGVPLGTILGVFTIIVLVRPSVKDLFEGRIAPEDEPGYDPEGEDNDLPVDPDYAQRIRRPLNP